MTAGQSGEAFSCKGITRSYHGVSIIEDISLSLKKGELASLIGVSGVGKTTLFNVLSGVDPPDKGEVLLRGHDITGIAGKVGYMMQKDLLLPHKKLVDNISLPLLLRGVKKNEARQHAISFFPRFGLLGCEGKYPDELSGGMRQRAALLRTYLAGGDVILLDEPFSALDAITKAEMHRWYLDVIGDIGVSTLFITHDIDEAIMLSDKIYILSGAPGKITGEISSQAHDDFTRIKRAILERIGGLDV